MKVLSRFKKFTKKRQQQQQLQKEEPEARDITEHSSQESLQCSDDANVDVTITKDEFCKNFKELIQGYENDEGEFIYMSQPRDASYSSETKWNSRTKQYDIKETTRLGEDVRSSSSATNGFDPSNYRSMPTEVRGITLRQLRAILPLIKRRCEEEKWTRPIYKDGVKTNDVGSVTLENATLYDVNEYIITPFTKYSQKSFVETLPSTKGTQPPRWFVSHYWGETFVHTMACLEQMVKDFDINKRELKDKDNKFYEIGGGMTEDTPVWICAFANNQHDLDSAITPDPADSAFAKAMSMAKFRVISILDVNNQVYSRLWCIYELYLTLILSKEQGIDGRLATYTYYEHEFKDWGDYQYKSAVGLVDGGNAKSLFEYNKSQAYFPKDRLFKALDVSIQDAKASRCDDQIKILNALVGRSGDNMKLEPLKNHQKYEILNNAVRGSFASTQNCIKSANNDEKKDNWKKTLEALQFSDTKIMELDILSLAEFKPQDVAAQDVAALFHHLPIGLEELRIVKCPHGRVAIDALLDWLENKSTNFKALSIRGACIGGQVGGKECGERLARFLARDDCTIKKIILHHTDLIGSRNVDAWIDCLEKNQSLKRVTLIGMAGYVERFVGKSPNTSVDAPKPSKNFERGKLYWDGTTFPDATLLKDQEKALKKTKSNAEQHEVNLSGFVTNGSIAKTKQVVALKKTISQVVDEDDLTLSLAVRDFELEREDALKEIEQEKTVMETVSKVLDEYDLNLTLVRDYELEREWALKEIEQEKTAMETVSKVGDEDKVDIENFISEDSATEKSASNWLCGFASCY